MNEGSNNSNNSWQNNISNNNINNNANNSNNSRQQQPSQMKASKTTASLFALNKPFEEYTERSQQQANSFTRLGGGSGGTKPGTSSSESTLSQRAMTTNDQQQSGSGGVSNNNNSSDATGSLMLLAGTNNNSNTSSQMQMSVVKKASGFQAILFEKLNEQRFAEPAVCDLAITVENRTFYAHKCLLIASCDYFAAMMLRSGMLETRQDTIELKGVSAQGLRGVLEFIYTGELCLTLGNVADLLRAVSHLQVKYALGRRANFLLSLFIFFLLNEK